MRVLLAHNYYRQAGGEDRVFESHRELLTQAGHEVTSYVRRNLDEVPESPPVLQRLALLGTTVHSPRTGREVGRLLRERRPHVAHFHNTLPLISPAGYSACRAAGVPVVQTLHNYRSTCANALLFRDGAICELCVGRRVLWPGVRYACYQQSRSASAVVALAQAVHRLAGVWRNQVDVLLALSDFSRRKLIESGLPAEKIQVLPNFVHPAPSMGAGGGGYALFVGRLSEEKGLSTLISAWRLLDQPLPIKLVGAGPERALIESAGLASVECLGPRSRSEVFELMRRAEFLVLPSEVYENFPMTLVEAMATGLPALVSGHGALEEIVVPGRTGLHMKPGDPDDLAAQVEALVGSPGRLREMRQETRRLFEQRYTAEHHLARLLEIYGSLVGPG